MPTVNYTIDANDDSGMSGNDVPTGYYPGGWPASDYTLYIDDGDAPFWHHCFLRFHGISIPGGATISSATLTLPRSSDNGNANDTIRLKCQDSATPAAGSDGDRPYARTYRSANVDGTFNIAGTTAVITVTSLITDLLSVYTSYGGTASDAILFGLAASSFGITSNSYRAIAYGNQHTGGSNAQLSITYTAGGAVINSIDRSINRGIGRGIIR
jgi:hypothetical protein